MTCLPFRTESSRGIRCYLTKMCSACATERASQLCDYTASDGEADGLCDAPLCKRCAVRSGGADFCPSHTECGERNL